MQERYMIYKVQDVKDSLNQMLQSRPEVLALWEGGSVATGFSDEYSDLDLMIISLDKNADTLFSAIEQHLQDHYGILRKFRIPEPAWHGLSQCFYLLKDSPLHFYCDIAITHPENPNRHSETDRHGHAKVWYDPQNLFEIKTTDPAELEEIRRHVWRSATSIDFLMRIELEKNFSRQNWMAVQPNYMSFLNRCLVPLMNLKYRPLKAEFGIRYSDRDYPKDMADFLANLISIANLEDVKVKMPQMFAIYDSLKEELSVVYSA